MKHALALAVLGLVLGRSLVAAPPPMKTFIVVQDFQNSATPAYYELRVLELWQNPNQAPGIPLFESSPGPLAALSQHVVARTLKKQEPFVVGLSSSGYTIYVVRKGTGYLNAAYPQSLTKKQAIALAHGFGPDNVLVGFEDNSVWLIDEAGNFFPTAVTAHRLPKATFGDLEHVQVLESGEILVSTTKGLATVGAATLEWQQFQSKSINVEPWPGTSTRTSSFSASIIGLINRFTETVAGGELVWGRAEIYPQNAPPHPMSHSSVILAMNRKTGGVVAAYETPSTPITLLDANDKGELVFKEGHDYKRLDASGKITTELSGAFDPRRINALGVPMAQYYSLNQLIVDHGKTETSLATGRNGFFTVTTTPAPAPPAPAPVVPPPVTPLPPVTTSKKDDAEEKPKKIVFDPESDKDFLELIDAKIVYGKKDMTREKFAQTLSMSEPLRVYFSLIENTELRLEGFFVQAHYFLRPVIGTENVMMDGDDQKFLVKRLAELLSQGRKKEILDAKMKKCQKSLLW